MYDFQW
ncbi:Protein CBG27192 [Caenorhabditis briggsae]|nr:Protein CBG27192 [Caenorhabditis briggsae]CAS00655.1 Protein CBG27192 [Caenorhabditis briggsae]